MHIDTHTSFEDKMRRLSAGPREPAGDFLIADSGVGSKEGVSYPALYRMAAAFLDRIVACVPENEPVCVCSDNKAVMAAAVLAGLASGRPLVVPYAATRAVIAETRTAAGFRMVIADSANTMPASLTVLTPEAVTDASARWKALPDVQPDVELVRLYTGGSTGSPAVWSKTVRNLFAEAFLHAERMRVTRMDCILATVPPNHIYGMLFSVLVPLVSGAGVITGIPTYPQEIIAGLAALPVSILVSVPMHYRVLNGHAIAAPSLRAALSSAGPLDASDGAAFYRATGIGVEEIYGSTETGGIATRCAAAGETALNPLSAVDWKIVEDRLYVKSDFLSGSLPRGADQYYAASDRVRMHAGGGFVLQGRRDSIVKVAGKRVDLENVREKLKAVAGVRDAVVIALPVAGGRENEVAALVAADVDASVIRGELARTLPAYACPRRIRMIAELPVTAAGKYDRKKVEWMVSNNVGAMGNGQSDPEPDADAAG